MTTRSNVVQYDYSLSTNCSDTDLVALVLCPLIGKEAGEGEERGQNEIKTNTSRFRRRI